MKGILKSVWLHAVLIVLAILFFDRLPNALRWPVRIYCLLALAWIVFRVVRVAIAVWRKDPKRLAFAFAGLAVFYLCFELLCVAFNKVATSGELNYRARDSLGISDEHRGVLERFIKGESSFYVFDPVIGWTIKTDGDFRKTYLANGQGLRADREYSKEVPEGKRRVICTGDSYTFGVEVRNSEAWPAILERESEEYETLNLGIPGTCLTQSYLRYEKLRNDFDHEIVVIGFMSNNIQRTVNVYRPFLQPSSGFPFVKPFAQLDDDGQLEVVDCPFQSLDDYRELLNQPAKVLGELALMDYHFRVRSADDFPFLPSARTWRYLCEQLPLESNFGQLINRGYDRNLRRIDAYRPDSYRLKAVSQLFDKFAKLVNEDGRRAVLLVYPHGGDIADYNRKHDPEYQSLVTRLRESGHECLDVLDCLKEKYGKKIPVKRVFLRMHYSPETNADVAAFVQRELARQGSGK